MNQTLITQTVASVGARLATLMMLIALAVNVPTPAAHATTFKETTLADSGEGSLRAAIAQANATNGADPGLNVNPKLGSLRDNGGPTETMALGRGSAAINAGVDANCPKTDQRGVSRPQGPHCDSGAFERKASD